MPATQTPDSPDPRRGWVMGLLLLLLVAGVFASRHWIDAERGQPSLPGAAWSMAVAEPSGTALHVPTAFEVTVHAADGRPVEGARVVFDLTMPAMEMPLNRFEAPAVPGKPGHYRGTGTFTMRGEWQIAATARRRGEVATARRIVQVR